MPGTGDPSTWAPRNSRRPLFAAQPRITTIATTAWRGGSKYKPAVQADRASLVFALDNLLDNAIRHAGATRIQLDARLSDNAVEFLVADGGRGIPDDELKRVQQPFVREGASRGSGLAIVRRIAAAHRGWFRLESRVEAGTTATLGIPVSHRMSIDQKRILIVKDDEGIARVLAANLRIDGFNVRWARAPHEALVESQSFRPDLVLLDLMFAGQPKGYEICRVLCQGGRCAVIIVSARGQREDKLRGFGAGADDYVTKPFDMEELAARINAVLRRTGACRLANPAPAERRWAGVPRRSVVTQFHSRDRILVATRRDRTLRQAWR